MASGRRVAYMSGTLRCDRSRRTVRRRARASGTQERPAMILGRDEGAALSKPDGGPAEPNDAVRELQAQRHRLNAGFTASLVVAIKLAGT